MIYVGVFFTEATLSIPYNTAVYSTNWNLIYYLFKPEHSIWKLLIIFFNIHFWLIRVRMKFIKKFNNMKSTSIYIKVYITLFKVWRYRFPNFYFWIQLFNLTPRSIPNSLTVNIRRNEQNT